MASQFLADSPLQWKGNLNTYLCIRVAATNLRFSPDGRWLVGFANQGHSVTVWRVQGKALAWQAPKAPQASARSAATASRPAAAEERAAHVRRAVVDVAQQRAQALADRRAAPCATDLASAVGAGSDVREASQPMQALPARGAAVPGLRSEANGRSQHPDVSPLPAAKRLCVRVPGQPSADAAAVLAAHPSTSDDRLRASSASTATQHAPGTGLNQQPVAAARVNGRGPAAMSAAAGQCGVGRPSVLQPASAQPHGAAQGLTQTPDEQRRAQRMQRWRENQQAQQLAHRAWERERRQKKAARLGVTPNALRTMQEASSPRAAAGAPAVAPFAPPRPQVHQAPTRAGSVHVDLARPLLLTPSPADPGRVWPTGITRRNAEPADLGPEPPWNQWESHFTHLFTRSVTADSEVLCDSMCVFTDDNRHVIVQSATQPLARGDAGPPATVSRSVSVRLVSLETGDVVDALRFSDDCFTQHRALNASVSLCGDVLALLSSATQDIHLYHVDSRTGFLHIRTLGAFVNPDDALTIDLHDQEEAAFRQSTQGSRPPSAHGALLPGLLDASRSSSPPDSRSVSPVPGEPLGRNPWRSSRDGGASAQGAAAGPGQPDTHRSAFDLGRRAHRRSAGGGVEAAGGFAAFPRESHGSLPGDATGTPAGAAAPMLAGVKQRILAFLFQAAYFQGLDVEALSNLPLREGGSLVEALTQTASESAAPHAAKGAAVAKFHRMVLLLEELRVQRVQLLDARHLLLRLRSYENSSALFAALYDLKDNRVLGFRSFTSPVMVKLATRFTEALHVASSQSRWHAHVPHRLLALEQIQTLVERQQAAQAAGRPPGGRGALPQPLPSLAEVPPPAGLDGASLAPPPPSLADRGAHDLVPHAGGDPANAHADGRADFAALMNPDTARRFLLGHLPSTCQVWFDSPYVDPTLFRHDRSASAYQLHVSMYRPFSLEQPSISFAHASRPERRAFALDCSTIVPELRGQQRGGHAPQYFVQHVFHPFLPLVVSLVHPGGATLVHFRRS